ncbi:Ig-like domain-containing protein, partial [Catenovulum agarivorans]|uniref:Ig-like domain-containing protein n=1 Tax=Catenovulum agarivorans TaxID=1172192 RepID=UPI0003750709
MNRTLLTSAILASLPAASFASVDTFSSFELVQVSLSSGYKQEGVIKLNRTNNNDSTQIRGEVPEGQVISLKQGSRVRQLVIIDKAVNDIAAFSRDLPADFDVAYLETGKNGKTQLISILSQYANLDAVHIVSHASSASLQLGNSQLNSSELTPDLYQALNQATREGADLLLFGCDFASNQDGESFLNKLKNNTHLDIAASTDKTGNPENGGDWELELIKGSIEITRPFSVRALTDFSGVLAITDGGGDTIDMGSFPIGSNVYTDNATYSNVKSTGYTLKLVAVSSGANTGNALGGTNYGYVSIDAYGDKDVDKLYLYFSSGETFDANSIKIYNGQESSKVIKFTSDQGDSQLSSNIPDVTSETVNLSGFTGITKLTIENNDGTKMGWGQLDDFNISNVTASDSTAPTFDGANSTPNDNATNVSVSNNIVIDFDENIALGTGNITIRNVTDSSDFEVFDVASESDGTTTSPSAGQISITGDKIYINPTNDLSLNRTYSIRIDSSAVDDAAGNSFAGISDDTSFNFNTPAISLYSADLAVVGRNTDNDDQFALVALADIPGNSVIFITDEGWDDSDFVFNGTEDVFKWTVPSGGLSGGTLIEFTNESTTTLEINDSNHGTVSSVNGSGDLSLGAGDQLFIYQTAEGTYDGTIQRLDSNSNIESGMIYAFNGDNSAPSTYGWLDAGNAHGATSSQAPDNMTVLTTSDGSGNASTANANGMLTQANVYDQDASAYATGEYDNYIYNGPMGTTDKATWLTRIHTTANWLANDTASFNIANSQHGGDRGSLGSAFTIGAADTTAPTFDSANSTPNDNATNVSVSDNIVIDFDEDIALGTGNITIRNVTDSSDFEVFDVASESDGTTTLPGAGRVSITSDKIYLNPTSNLTGNRSYSIRIDSTAVDDTAGNSFAGISDDTSFNFSTVNTAPVVDLDSTSGSDDNSASFSEAGGAVNIASNASVTESDGDNLTTITVTLTNDQDGASEGLNVSASAQDALTGISGSSDITLQDTITISGATASASEVATFLQAITYNNTSSSPNETARTVTVVVNDGTDNSTSRTSTISVSNVTAASSTAASFNTTNGTNLSPAITFTSDDETLTIADTSHITGSTADGGSGTDTLFAVTGSDLTGFTSLTGFETLTPDNDASLTLSETQHDAFTTINGSGTNQFTLSSANGDASITGDSDIETYVLGAGFNFTLATATQNVTGSSSDDTVNVAGFTATGVLSGGSGTDTLQLDTGASISGATVSSFETLSLTSGAAVTMTEAQHDNFSSVVAAGTESITISDVSDGLTGNSAVETYVLSVANTFTLGVASQNVTGSSGDDTINVDSFTATGTLAGGSGTDTLSINGGSISGATISGFENLTVSDNSSATITPSQLSSFSGTISAGGTETLTISGDGDVTTVTAIENYTVDDDSTNTRAVTLSSAAHSVTANSSSDAVTFDIGTLTFTGTLTGNTTTADTLSMSNGANISGGTISNIVNLTLASGASVSMTASQHQSFTGTVTAAGSESINISGDGDFTVFTAVENYSVDDDSTNTRTITLGSSSANVSALSSSDAVTFDVGSNTYTGTLTGDTDTADVVSASDGADLTGGSFANIGSLTLTSGVTVAIDAANVSDFSTAITGSGGSETLKLMDGGTFNFSSTSVSEIENLAIGTNNIFTITLTDNFDSNGSSVTVTNASGSAIAGGISLNASALSGDELIISATDFDGSDTFTGGSAADTIRPGGGTDSMTGNDGNDNFMGEASDLNGDTITDLSIGDIVTLTGVTGLTTSNVRFNGTSTLQIDTNATDFSSVEVSISLSNSPANNLDFTVADNGANTDITFITPNDVPVFSSLNGGSTFTENGSAVVIDSDATVADTELDALDSGAGNYNNATLTIARNGGANSEDVFANNGLLGTLTESSSFTFNSTSVGTVTTNSSGTLVLTFNTNATSAIVDSVIQNITYQNTSEDPASSVTLDFTFNDGTANSTGTNQASVSISAQNDAPTDISLSATAANQSATGVGANIGGLSTTDVDSADSHTFTLVSVGASDNGTCSSDAGNSSFQIDGSTLESQNTVDGGSYVICVQTSDGTATFQESFTITITDDVAPDAPSTPDLDAASDTGTSSTDNITNDTTPTLSGTAESGSTVTLYSDQVGGGTTSIGSGTATDGNWQITTSALTAGLTHSILAKATDSSSNQSASSSGLSVTIDTTAPSAPSTPDLSAASDTGDSNTDNLTNNTTPTFTGTGPNNGAITLISSVDGTIGSTTAADGSWTIASSTLTVGIHTITARSTDTAGNTADSSGLSVEIDTSVESVTITTPIETDGIVNAAEDNDVLISGSGADANASVSVSITDGTSTSSQNVTADGSGAWTISGSEFDVSTFNNGTLTVSATQTDAAGNTSTAATQNITLDNSAPSALTITTPIEGDGYVNASEDEDVLIAGSGAEAGNSVTVSITDNNATLTRTVTADGSGNWTISGSEFDVSAFNNGTLTVSATQTDTAGNTSTAATQDITLDNSAPSAVTITTPIETDGIVNAAEDSDVLIVGSAAEANASVTVTITDGTSTLNQNVTADGSGAWTISGSEFDVSTFNNGTLTVSATQTDTAGNTSTAASTTITLDNTAPSAPSISTPIEIDNIVNASEDDTVLISGSGAEANATITITIGSVSIQTTADGSGNWTIESNEIDISALTNGTLTVTVTQTDAAGNESSSATQNITLDNGVPAAVTITTPIETDGIVNAAEDNDVLISGSGAESGNSVTVSITDNNSTVSNTVTADGSGNWTLSGGELDVSTFNNGTLTVSATQTDNAGNTSTAATQNITLDNSAPSALTITTPIEGDGYVNAAEDADVLIAGSGAENNASVTVTITDGSNSLEQTVTADASGDWTISGSEFDVSSFNNGTLTVSATQTDTAGNTSTAATQDITLDNLAPSAVTITTPIETDGIVNAAEDDDVLIAGSGAESGNSVTVSITDNNNTTTRTVTADSSGNWTLSGSEIDVSGFNNGTLTVSATQTDTAGNTSTAATQDITLDNSAPSAPSISTPIEIDNIVNASEDDTVLISGSGAEASASLTITIGSVSIQTTADGSGNWTIESNEIDISALTNGTLTVTVTQTDAAGNDSSSATQNITLDNGVPAAVTITTPIETDGIVNAAEDNDVLIEGSGAEANTSVTVTITDGANSSDQTVTADGSGAWTISGSEFDVSTFNNGTLTVSATQTDTAGNTSTAATQDITLDNSAPSALSITTPIEEDGYVNAAEDEDVLIAGSGAEANASVTVTITDDANSLSRTVTADGSGNWTIAGSEFDVSAFNNGTLTVSATQTDTAGNTSTVATQSITLDNSAPSAVTITTPIETDGIV